MDIFKTGEKFPLAIPNTEGAIFDIYRGEMVLLIHYPGLTEAELDAFNKGLNSYSLIVADDGLICWVWKFSEPVGFMDSAFHAGMYNDDRCEKLIQDGGNRLTIFIIDGDILRRVQIIGMYMDSVTAFHEAIKKQNKISREDCMKSIINLQKFSPEELFIKGRQFQIG